MSERPSTLAPRASASASFVAAVLSVSAARPCFFSTTRATCTSATRPAPIIIPCGT
ncbi:hypothetical protein ACFJIS_18250 [Variovorax boronicumulans]|uniref:hypothetical protein n=1 Tax=Variovorax boronicumulans TaxID=436515 RepID=UPI0036F2E4D2